jgi:hypothetical protein
MHGKHPEELPVLLDALPEHASSMSVAVNTPIKQLLSISFCLSSSKQPPVAAGFTQ